MKNDLFFDNSNLKLSNTAIYTIQVKLVSIVKFNEFSSHQKIDVASFSKGIFLKEKSFVKKIIKK